MVPAIRVRRVTVKPQAAPWSGRRYLRRYRDIWRSNLRRQAPPTPRPGAALPICYDENDLLCTKCVCVELAQDIHQFARAPKNTHHYILITLYILIQTSWVILAKFQYSHCRRQTPIGMRGIITNTSVVRVWKHSPNFPYILTRLSIAI